MNELFIPLNNILSLFRRAKGLYNFGYNILHGSTLFNKADNQHKLNMVLSNPAVLKVFALQCDLFSMGRVCVQDVRGEEPKEIEDDPFLELIRHPNPFTNTESQFLWDFMFWNMLGTSYSYVDSVIVDRVGNKIYFLDPARIEWPLEFERRKDKMVFSDAEIKQVKKIEITYRYADGTTFKFPYDRMISVFDLTNSIGNFYKGPSRLDALYKIISNAEHTLDAENVNIRYTSKFIVGADNKTGTIPGMGDEEKKNIEQNIDKEDKNVYPVRSKPTIARFIDDLANLKLPETYLHQYFLIGNMYGIPRDVLEAYNSATYENQEKARAAHVNYCLQPKGEQFMDAFEVHFGYRQQNKNIKITWDHLPFVQVFAREQAETKKVQVEVLNSLLAARVPIEQINKFLGTEFEQEEPEPGPEEGSTEGDQGEGAPGENSGDSEEVDETV